MLSMAVGTGHGFGRLGDMRRQYGAAATCEWVAGRAAKRLFQMDVSRMVWIELARLQTDVEVDPEFTFRQLTPDEVARLAADPAYELSPEFAAAGPSASNVCFAALHRGRTVAHYGWYATGSIGGEHHMGVPMWFPPDMAYMYNAFTHPDFRGRRLHGMAMAAAAPELEARGIRRIVSTIGTTNYPSLRSFYRLGFVDIGRLVTIGRGARRWSLRPKGAEALGIRFRSDS